MLVDFSKYSGFIFDLDGTLIDSMPYHIGAWQQVCREHGYEISADLCTNVVAFPHATSF